MGTYWEVEASERERYANFVNREIRICTAPDWIKDNDHSFTIELFWKELPIASSYPEVEDVLPVLLKNVNEEALFSVSVFPLFE